MPFLVFGPLVNRVRRNVRPEESVVLPVPDRPLGPDKSGGQNLNFGIFRDEVVKGRVVSDDRSYLGTFRPENRGAQSDGNKKKGVVFHSIQMDIEGIAVTPEKIV